MCGAGELANKCQALEDEVRSSQEKLASYKALLEESQVSTGLHDNS